MASKKDKNAESKNPGVKKRDMPEQDAKPDPMAPIEEDGVVRAPKAPTKAPNAPKKEEKPSGKKGRRVVDPKKAAAKARKKREEQKKKEKQARRTTKEEGGDSDVGQAMGVRFGDADATMDDFAAMLDGGGTGSGVPERHRFEIGDTVEGTVVSIGKRYVFVDIGRPDEGIVDRAQYEDEEGNLELEMGDERQFYVIGFNDGVELGKELGDGDNSMAAVETAYGSGVPISGRVTGTNKGGFEVNIAGVEAFCPISQIELGFTEDPEIHVGNSYPFEVQEIKDDGRSVVVSRTAILEKERAARRKETLSDLDVGDEIEGVITRVADFGAFVDIGGVEGLVHVSELSHTFFDNPSDIVSVGDNVTVQVLSIEEEAESDGAPLRIGLSMKEAQPDPWMKVNEEFAVGETVMGTIVRLAPFGAFVELMPGVEGLVHVSEISRTEHVATPDDFVEVNEKVQVEIQDIDLMRRRISLSMAAAQDDPWKKVEERFSIGMEVTGTVSNTEDFGAFIDLGDGITALLPRSEMNLPSEVTPHRKYQRAEEVTARVLNIEPERRRMALTLREASEIGDDSQKKKKKKPSPSGPRSYSDNTGSKKGSLGTLGDLLKSRNDED